MAKKKIEKVYRDIDKLLLRIKKQIQQPSGYQFNPELLKIHLQAALKGRFFSSKLYIWNTIRIGTGLKNDNEFFKAFQVCGCYCSNLTKELMGKPEFVASISLTEKRIKLCMLTTEQIIGKEGTTEEVFAGIQEIGGVLLPAEAGPQLRLQYKNQPVDEWLILAMEPLVSSNNDYCLFIIKHNYDEFNLEAGHTVKNNGWALWHKWVFALRD